MVWNPNVAARVLILNHFIKELSLARRPAPQTQSQNLERDDFASGGKCHHIADPNRRAGLFDAVPVQPDMSFDAPFLRQDPGFAEACMPEPFVDAKRFAQISVRCDEPGKPGKRRVRLDGLGAPGFCGHALPPASFARPAWLPPPDGSRVSSRVRRPAPARPQGRSPGARRCPSRFGLRRGPGARRRSGFPRPAQGCPGAPRGRRLCGKTRLRGIDRGCRLRPRRAQTT